MKLFRSLNNSLKAGILTILISLLGFLATLFLFFNGYSDIPLGILLGGFVIGGLNIIAGIVEKKDEQKNSSVASIIMIIVRFIVLIACMIIIALMNYRWDVKIFNLYAFVGVYTVSIITLVITYLTERRQKCD